MTVSKRVLDLGLMALILPILIPIAGLIALLVLIKDGRPIFYASERMVTPTRSFKMWKFRTMALSDADAEGGTVSAGYKSARVTALGRVLRRTHADEIPQAWNLIRGHLSFVGPRPPLRSVVERFPDVYAEVLKNRPGLTGMACLFFCRHEELVMHNCKNAEQAEAIYARRCVRQKARLDLIYQRNQSFLLDLWLLWLTVAREVRLPSRRSKAKQEVRTWQKLHWSPAQQGSSGSTPQNAYYSRVQRSLDWTR